MLREGLIPYAFLGRSYLQISHVALGHASIRSPILSHCCFGMAACFVPRIFEIANRLPLTPFEAVAELPLVHVCVSGRFRVFIHWNHSSRHTEIESRVSPTGEDRFEKYLVRFVVAHGSYRVHVVVIGDQIDVLIGVALLVRVLDYVHEVCVLNRDDDVLQPYVSGSLHQVILLVVPVRSEGATILLLCQL